jgi:predicted DNA-binding transcriptional regulator YafY
MMNKANRLLFILNLIRSRTNLRARDLARECGVSERTIYRDIKSVSSANIPVYYDNGYKFLTDAFLPPLNLSLNEYLAIHLGLSSRVVNSKPVLKEAGKRALAKLEALMPENLKDEYVKLKEKMSNRFQLDRRPSELAESFPLAFHAEEKHLKGF